MKKALVAVLVSALASTASAAILNSPHDLATNGYNGNAAAISACQFCHAPHYGNVEGVAGQSSANGFGQIPLWNRRAPDQTNWTYNPTTVNPNPTLGAGSLTCLSCHDGASDMGQVYRGTNGFAGAVPMQVNSRNIGATYSTAGGYQWATAANLSDDHPVGVPYASGPVFDTIANVQAAGLKLYNRDDGSVTVECGTCHEPHDDVTFGKFLRISSTGLCTECHTK